MATALFGGAVVATALQGEAARRASAAEYAEENDYHVLQHESMQAGSNTNSFNSATGEKAKNRRRLYSAATSTHNCSPDKAARFRAMSSMVLKRGSVQGAAAGISAPGGGSAAAGRRPGGGHRGSLEQGRRAHATKAGVRAISHQFATGHADAHGHGRARMTHIRKSQVDLFSTSTVQQVPKTYDDTMKVNAKREAYLQDARRFSPISAVMYATKLRRSIIPRLFSYPIVWVIILMYMACATLARTRDLYIERFGDIFGPYELQDGAYEGASVLVTFMVVFYLGYCYNRYFEQYNALRFGMSLLIDLMINVRVSLNKADTELAYSYINLLHATAYIGMTPVLNSTNFLNRFIETHDLARNEKIEERLSEMDIDHDGANTFNTCAAWTIQLFQEALKRGELDGETYRVMLEEVLQVRGHLNSLYAYQHQVIPFVYSHLVSMSCFLYLFFFAVDKGARFTPESTYIFGLAVPAASFFIALITTTGLVEVGQAIADPFGGNDPEDFALPTFLNTTAKQTFHIAYAVNINAPHTDVGADHGDVPEMWHSPPITGRKSIDGTASTASMAALAARRRMLGGCASSPAASAARAAAFGPNRSGADTLSALPRKGMGKLEA